LFLAAASNTGCPARRVSVHVQFSFPNHCRIVIVAGNSGPCDAAGIQAPPPTTANNTIQLRVSMIHLLEHALLYF
jgi:hypothetical protein